ncbi:MAG TPA: hypothetical protein VF521_05895 [Pyrinomonadaceae bacterium]
MHALSLRRLGLLLTTALCLTAVARAQAGGGSVRMSGVVSSTVALSSVQGADVPGVRVTSARNADGSLTVTLSGSARELTEVRVPVHVRSNTNYTLLAATRADGADLSSLLVVEARPTGNLTATDADAALNVAAPFDGRRGPNNLNRPDLSSPAELLNGPRVSAGGTLLSPDNALEVVLSVNVEPRTDAQSWTVELLLSAADAKTLLR